MLEQIKEKQKKKRAKSFTRRKYVKNSGEKKAAVADESTVDENRQSEFDFRKVKIIRNTRGSDEKE